MLSNTVPIFSANNAVATLLRNHDWTQSTLGEPSRWPSALVTVVRLVLDSKFPMFVAWGKDMAFLYNDAYAEIMGNKHLAGLAAPFQSVWQESWPDISPIIDRALSGESSYFENLPVIIERAGYPEQAWFTFSYSPVYDDSALVGGMVCNVVETTNVVRDRVLLPHQLRTQPIA